MSFERILDIDLPKQQSCFLFGARQTGKTSYLRVKFPSAKVIDLLKTDLYLRYQENPSYLREDLLALKVDSLHQLVVIDEVQKIPQLLDEVHWLIENTKMNFILCGSSARQLKRSGVNLLGGRAWSFKMFPLVYPELGKDLDLLKIFNRGLLPSHYLSKNPLKDLEAYTQDYLTEQIKAESLVRNLSAFSKFLKSIAFSHGELTNYSNIARDCGVDAKTVKEYYQILIDTLLGYYLEPFSRKVTRDTIRSTPKFYLFDVGLANYICQREMKSLQGAEAGKSLEHYIFLELLACIKYRGLRYDLQFWRTQDAKHEVDFIISKQNEPLSAIEIKITTKASKQDYKSLLSFHKEFPRTKLILVSQDPVKRLVKLDDSTEILVYPYLEFLQDLWSDFFDKINQ